jgi:hypothetical protein
MQRLELSSASSCPDSGMRQHDMMNVVLPLHCIMSTLSNTAATHTLVTAVYSAVQGGVWLPSAVVLVARHKSLA